MTAYDPPAAAHSAAVRIARLKVTPSAPKPTAEASVASGNVVSPNWMLAGSVTNDAPVPTNNRASDIAITSNSPFSRDMASPAFGFRTPLTNELVIRIVALPWTTFAMFRPTLPPMASTGSLGPSPMPVSETTGPFQSNTLPPPTLVRLNEKARFRLIIWIESRPWSCARPSMAFIPA